MRVSSHARQAPSLALAIEGRAETRTRVASDVANDAALSSVTAPGAVVLPLSVPVLPGTLLGLELLLQRSALDLRATSDLLCEDPGALLHVFAMVREELADGAEPPARLEDCIATLSAERLLRTLVQAGAVRREHAGFAHFARHGALVGRYAQAVAESLGLSRERALLVGTLHELGSLPAVLGWPALHAPEHDAVLRCGDLCRRFGLPRELCAALDAVHRGCRDSVWVAIIGAAHELLGSA